MTSAPGVELRPVGAGDKDRLLVWRNSPEVSAYMYTDHQITPEEHERWFAGIEGDARRAYWIIEMDGAPVGLANLYDIDRRQRRCAWAYYLAEPAVRGRGIGGCVEYLMIEKVFGEYGLTKLWCEVLASNVSVRKLHEAFGFQVEARLCGHAVRAHKRVDVLGLGLLAADWRAKRAAMADRLRARGFTPPVVVA